jgi:hypothetical protein
MRATREYSTFREFEREELRTYRNNAWTINDLIEDFLTEDLETELLDAREREAADDGDD